MLPDGPDARDALVVVAAFRSESYACLTARSDALFELSDALMCTIAASPQQPILHPNSSLRTRRCWMAAW
ncbi:hypothetical protein EF909_10360 [Streptomyces sp. WAC01280]|nr:hypothetical protein EF909_10360 [Streptomyces sp. WAC01280]